MMGLRSRSGRAKTAALDSRNLWGTMLQLRIPIQLREQLEGRICPSSSMLSMLGVFNARSLAKSILLSFLTYFSTLFQNLLHSVESLLARVLEDGGSTPTYGTTAG